MPSPASPPLDPALLATFRQQGGAIVARERGLTPACRVKLAGLARSLGIAEEYVETAIRTLRETEPEAPPNPKVEKFRDRLRKDLAGNTRTIIGPRIESQILAKAGPKYALDESLVRQVIGEVAAELGLTRITAGDAIDNLTSQIDELIDDSTWLAREGWDRLRSAGNRWGIELEVVDELIEEKLASNRAAIRQNRFWMQATLLGAGGAVATAAIALVVLLLACGNGDIQSTVETAPAVIPATPGASASKSERAVQPTWWDVDLALEMAETKSRFAGFGGASELMASGSASERAAGYEKLINHVRAAAPAKLELLTAVERIFIGAHSLEEDDAAAGRFRAALLALLPTPDTPLPARPDQYEVAYWAAEASVAGLRRTGLSNARKTELASALGSALSTSFDPAAGEKTQQDLARTRTTWLAYQQLTAAAPKQPAAVATLFRPLSDRVSRILPADELVRLESTLLSAALPAAGSHWHAYEAALVRCASSPDPLTILKLTDTLAKCEEPELVSQLSQLLILRVGVRPATSAKADVVAAIRKALGATGVSAASSAADRWQLLRDQADAALASSPPPLEDHFEVLRHTVQLAHLTTQAIALAQGEAGFASFDAGMAEPPTLERPRATAGTDKFPAALPVARLTSRALSAREQRDLERFSTMLGGFARQTPPERLNALRAVAGLADAAADVSPTQAESIAKYLLGEKSNEEHQAVVGELAGIRRWKHLRLAVADHWDESQLTADQVSGFASALIGRVLPAELATAGSVRRYLLESVLHDLADPAAEEPVRPGDTNQLFDSAASELTEIYRQRARILGVAPTEYQAAASPAQALELSLWPVAESLRGSAGDSGYLAAFKHLHTAAKFVADDDLRQTVTNQRLLIELSRRRAARLRPQQAAAAMQLDVESLAFIGGSTNVLAQLHEQESTLLKLWMLYAPEA